MKKTIKFLSVAMFCACLQPSVYADHDNYAGLGDGKCYELTDELWPELDEEKRKYLRVMVTEWAVGYMSGLNRRAEESEKRDLPYNKYEFLFDTIFSTCKNNPDEQIGRVVDEIYRQRFLENRNS